MQNYGTLQWSAHEEIETIGYDTVKDVVGEWVQRKVGMQPSLNHLDPRYLATPRDLTPTRVLAATSLFRSLVHVSFPGRGDEPYTAPRSIEVPLLGLSSAAFLSTTSARRTREQPDQDTRY